MSDKNKIRVLIVDDHDMLREGLATFLRAFDDLKLVGEAASGVEAVRLCREHKPDVVLMDLLMPELDGVSAIQQIHLEQPQIKIIALSSFSEDELVKSALRAGATSYLLKNVSAARLAEAIRTTQSGLPTLSPEITGALIETAPAAPPPPAASEPLTQRELDVLRLMVAGMTNAEIAQRLKISPFTIKGHVSNILGKLGASSRTEAVAFALKNKIVAT